MVTFMASRSKTELVAPARPTPNETKTLSDLDDNLFANRFYMPIVEFFQPRGVSINGHSPADQARAIKAALTEVLVYYYQGAGRMRESSEGKLVVDCTGEGVSFVEADATARLEDMGTPLVPPYPCLEELLPDAGDIMVVVGKPIVFMQVTRFECGGFIIGMQFNHCMADGYGMVQFIKAITDVARGEAAPAVLPVWGREILAARSPPCPDSVLQKQVFSIFRDPAAATPLTTMASGYFLFGPAEMSALRSRLPEDIGAACTVFELLTAAIWRCRTVAWGRHTSGKRTPLCFVANVRRRWEMIPQGYYGNALLYHTVDVDGGELCESPLSHAIKLIREAKKDTSEERIRSCVDLVASARDLRTPDGKPALVYDEEVYFVSDWTRLDEDGVDLGWAERVGGGAAMPMSLVSFNGKCRNSKGDESVVVSMLLPERVMNRCEKEITACVG